MKLVELPQTPRQAFEALAGKRPDLLLTEKRGILAPFYWLDFIMASPASPASSFPRELAVPMQGAIFSAGKGPGLLIPTGGFN